MTDDLVKKLRSPANVFYEYKADDGEFLREAADRIEHLQKLLEMRDVFIVKHGLWHEFVGSVELKDD